MKLYCIIATREFDGEYTFHKKFDHEPTRSEILQAIIAEDCGYDDNYGKFRFFEINRTLTQKQ